MDNQAGALQTTGAAALMA